MIIQRSRTTTQTRPGRPLAWPRKVKFGRVTVPVYRRKRADGRWQYLVGNYSNGKRRLDSFADEAAALEAAAALARRLSEREVVAAGLTNEQAAEYAAAVQALEPLGLKLLPAVHTLAEAVKIVHDLHAVISAARFYAARHHLIEPKSVSDAVAELLAVKEARGASIRYLQDLRHRLGTFAEAFRKNIGDVTTAEIQTWLDSRKLAPQSYINFRRVLHTLFEHAISRGWACDNPVAAVERTKVKDREIEIYTVKEMSRLLAAAEGDVLPCIALGAFAGLRSAEILRLEWADIDLQSRCIVVGARQSKTATRRVVPIQENLLAWLAPYSGRQGKVWPRNEREFYKALERTAAAAGVRWKPNGLRHSYASFQFAITGDAGRVAGELGNSVAVVHRHYRELVKPPEAAQWFAIRPQAPSNVVSIASR